MNKTIFTAAMVCLMAGPAAAKPFDAAGTATGTSKTETIEVGADHVILNSKIEYTKFEMGDATNPMKDLKGSCFGVVELRGGAAEGGGICVFNGLEGDSVVMGWDARRMNPKGQIVGYWSINSGTGLFLQASGGGTFQSSVNQSNGTATNTLKGAINLR